MLLPDTIARKLRFSTLGLASLVFICVMLSLWSQSKVSDAFRFLSENTLPTYQAQQELSSNLQELNYLTRSLDMVMGKNELAERNESINRVIQRLSKSVGQHSSNIKSQKLQDNLKELEQVIHEDIKIVNRILELQQREGTLVKEAYDTIRQMTEEVEFSTLFSEMRPNGTAQEITFALSSMQSVLAHIVELPDTPSVKEAEQRYNSEIRIITSLLVKLPENSHRSMLAVGALNLSFSGKSDEENIFHLKENLLEQKNQLFQQYDRIVELEKKSRELGQSLIDDVKRETTESIKDLNYYLSMVGIILKVTLCIAIISALFIVHFLLQHGVIDRLHALTVSMKSLSDGDTDIDIEEKQNDEIGKAYQALSTFRDNAVELRCSHEKIQALQERFDLAVRGASDGLWDWEVGTDSVWYSDRFRELLGYSDIIEFPDKLDSWFSTLHPEDQENTQKAIDAHLENGTPYDVEYRCKLKDGDYRWFRARGKAEKDTEGKSLRMAGSIQDITDRKTAEIKLLRNEQELQLIFDNVPARIWFKDEENLILRLNKAAATSMGGKVSDFSGKSTYELFPEMAEKYHQDDLNVLNSGTSQLGIVEKYTPADGQHGWVMTDKIPAHLEGMDKRSILVVSTDITERIQAEEDLRRSNVELEQFAYVASHDLQEPLRMVGSFAELLGEKYNDQFDEQGKKWLSFLVDGAQRMRELVQDLLSYSRIGQKEVTYENIEMNQLAASVVNDLELSIDEHNVELNIETLPECFAEPLQIRLLLQNLITNAVKFKKDGIAPVIQLRGEKDDSSVTYSVSDNGIGIDPKYADKIFLIFQRLHSNSEYSGTGLGLAICKKIVERHQGELWFDSNPGEGTTFHFRLPAT